MVESEASNSFSSYLFRIFFGGDEVSLASIVMRFTTAALVIFLTRHAANVLAMSVSGTANGAGRRPATGAAAALLERAASWRAGGDGAEQQPREGAAADRRVPLLSRLTGSTHPGGGTTAASTAYARSKSMAVPGSRGLTTSSTSSAVQFRPLGDAPPVPEGADVAPHYIFLVHGWLGNEQEMSYLGTALAEALDGPKSSTTSSTTDENTANNDANDDADYIHVSSNQEDIEEEASDDEEYEGPDIVIHKPTCNNGRTTDGIAAGGTRLAEEIAEFIVADIRERQKREKESDDSNGRESTEHHVTISFVGNSLGGLYSRYALSLLPSELHLPTDVDGDEATTVVLHPNVFCTTATPHLGVASHTYLPVPRFAERAIGRVLDITGMDLFRADAADYPQSTESSNVAVDKENVENDATNDDDDDEDNKEPKDDEPLLNSSTEADESEADESDADDAVAKPMRDLIYRMCTEPAYINPLSSFKRRIAYANAFGTDFQVPTNTAAFLSDKSTYPHRYCNVAEKEGHEFIASVLHTDPADSGVNAGNEKEDDILVMSRSLDALGWTKVFIDTRGGIPVPSLSKPGFLRRQSKSGGEDVRAELRKFVKERKSSSLGGEAKEAEDTPVPESLQQKRDQRLDKPEEETDEKSTDDMDEKLSSVTVMIESRELVELMNPSERMHFPLGHTVMVANSKSDTYAKINAKGQPIMNKLASDLVASISDFSY